MLRPGWFSEYSPWQQKVYDQILETIENNYKMFGYDHVSTSAMEKNSVLQAKWWEETSKQIFGVYWLAQWAEDAKDYSLRFDLTIPFARYVVDWKSSLNFPFKRYQIDSVWRGERQQKWRYKEFVQADIDAIRSNSQGDVPFYDWEVVFVIYKSLFQLKEKFDISERFVVHINNKKVISSFLDYVCGNDQKKSHKLSVLLDKFDKIWEEEFFKELSNLWFDKETKNKIYDFITMDVDYNLLSSIRDFIPDQNFQEWIDQLKLFLSNLLNMGEIFEVDIDYKINFGIVRGLDYYTWIVFETFIQDYRGYSSIASWWRYDDLTSNLDPKSWFSWVGGSIWVDRLFSWLTENNKIDQNYFFSSKYFFVNFEETNQDILYLARWFIKEGRQVEIFPYPQKMKKQLDYANKKWIRYVVILGEWEKTNWVYKLKDMVKWTEETYQI